MDLNQNQNLGQGPVNNNKSASDSSTTNQPVDNLKGFTTAPNNLSSAVTDGGVNEGRNKIYVLGYILPILFFIPLLGKNTSVFARFHANQQLVILIVFVVANFVASYIPVVNLIVLGLWVLVMMIGVASVLMGKMAAIPLISKIRIIK